VTGDEAELEARLCSSSHTHSRQLLACDFACIICTPRAYFHITTQEATRNRGREGRENIITGGFGKCKAKLMVNCMCQAGKYEMSETTHLVRSMNSAINALDATCFFKSCSHETGGVCHKIVEVKIGSAKPKRTCCCIVNMLILILSM
jgi:hypothetical protein